MHLLICALLYSTSNALNLVFCLKAACNWWSASICVILTSDLTEMYIKRDIGNIDLKSSSTSLWFGTMNCPITMGKPAIVNFAGVSL